MIGGAVTEEPRSALLSSVRNAARVLRAFTQADQQLGVSDLSRKLGLGARACMSAAQRLYEAGHITYMRTDGIDMAPEAVMAARDAIKARFGAEYLPKSPRMYKNKAKNAQEAHECIRPTDMMLSPDRLPVADKDQKALYDLIWKRTIASQMESARMERTTVEIASPDGQVGLRATGQVMLFDGFLRVYDQGRDDEDEDDGRRLPLIQRTEVVRQFGLLHLPPGHAGDVQRNGRRGVGVDVELRLGAVELQGRALKVEIGLVLAGVHRQVEARAQVGA